jgi:hypothetical protein
MAHAPRFGVLQLATEQRTPRYVIYDRLTQRITNGVYFVLHLALENAANANTNGGDVEDMTPCPAALGLVYPKVRSQQ